LNLCEERMTFSVHYITTSLLTLV